MSAIFSDLLPIFNALPGAYLLLSPAFTIEAVSEAYVAATLTQRTDLVGRYVFDVFPDNPQTPSAYAVRNVHASLSQVLATGQPHELVLQPYDLPDPAHAGQFIARTWQTRNVPVLDAQGQVTHIIHSIVDMTAHVQAAGQLRESELREQAALAEVEHRRGELQRIFEQAPVAIAAYRGPKYIIELANPLVCALWGRTPAQALGTPLLEVLPEITGQGFEQLLDQVMATGETHVAKEMPSTIDRNGRRDTVYWNFVYLPLREDDGRITGVMVVATEVSEQVHARQQIQDLNTQLAAANQALHTSNGELLANQEEVLLVQQLLETSVADRTRQLEAALAEAQVQRGHVAQQQRLLDQILGQVPASIATLSGPEHRYTFFNDHYQVLAGGRMELGKTVAEVFPEVVEQNFIGQLDQVYATGTPLQGREAPALLYSPATGRSEPCYIDFTYQPLRSEQGDTQGVLAFIVDVTDKVLARQQAAALQAQLQAATKG